MLAQMILMIRVVPDAHRFLLNWSTLRHEVFLKKSLKKVRPLEWMEIEVTYDKGVFVDKAAQTNSCTLRPRVEVDNIVEDSQQSLKSSLFQLYITLTNSFH